MNQDENVNISVSYDIYYEYLCRGDTGNISLPIGEFNVCMHVSDVCLLDYCRWVEPFLWCNCKIHRDYLTAIWLRSKVQVRDIISLLLIG